MGFDISLELYGTQQYRVIPESDPLSAGFSGQKERQDSYVVQ